MKEVSSASSKVMFLVNFIVIVIVITAWFNVKDMSPKVTGASISDITGAPTVGTVVIAGKTYYYDKDKLDDKTLYSDYYPRTNSLSGKVTTIEVTNDAGIKATMEVTKITATEVTISISGTTGSVVGESIIPIGPPAAQPVATVTVVEETETAAAETGAEETETAAVVPAEPTPVARPAEDLKSSVIEVDDWGFNPFYQFNFKDGKWENIGLVDSEVPDKLKKLDYKQGIEYIASLGYEVDWDNSGREIDFHPKTKERQADFIDTALADPAYQHYLAGHRTKEDFESPELSPRIEIVYTGPNVWIQYNFDSGVWEMAEAGGIGNRLTDVPGYLNGKTYEDGIDALSKQNRKVIWDVGESEEKTYDAGYTVDKDKFKDDAVAWAKKGGYTDKAIERKKEETKAAVPAAPEAKVAARLPPTSGTVSAMSWKTITIAGMDNMVKMLDGDKLIGYTDKEKMTDIYDKDGKKIGTYDKTKGSYQLTAPPAAPEAVPKKEPVPVAPSKPKAPGEPEKPKAPAAPAAPKVPGIETKAISITKSDGKEGTLDVPEEIYDALELEYKGKDAQGKDVWEWKNLEWANEKEVHLKDGSVWTPSGDSKTWTRKLEGVTVEEYRYSDKGSVHYNPKGTSQYRPIGKKPTDLAQTFAKDAKVDKDGNLVINKKVIDGKKFSLDSKEGIITNLEDKSRIIALDKGTAEIDKDSKNIVIKMEGQEPQRLTAQQYKALTGTELNADTAAAAIRTDAADLGFIIEALGRERISLDKVTRADGEEGRVDYFAGTNTKVTIDPSAKTVTVTTASGFLTEDKDGKKKGEPIGAHTITTKEIKDGKAYVNKIESKDAEGKKTGLTTWTLDGKGQVQSMTLEVDGVEKKFNEVEREKLGDKIWQFYRYESGKNNLYYNYEYGGWYAKNEKGEYRKATEDDFKDAKVSKEEADKLAENIRKANDGKDKEDGKPTKTARDIQRFFGALESAASGGLGRFFSLFMEDEKLAEWREGVDDFLCSTIIGGGTSCWTSKICSVWVENKPSGGIMYAETPSGMLDIAVHVEAHKSSLSYPEEGLTEEYFYKLTYVVKNPTKKQLGFNVILSGERTTALYSGNIIVEPGGQSSRVGASAVVQYSNYDYNTVCIKFDRTIKVTAASLDKVCNKIVGRGEKVLEAKFRKKEAITTEYTKQTEAEITELNI